MNPSTHSLEVYHSTRPPGLLETKSSVPNELYRADWRFLLPRLHYESMLYLGAPSELVLDVLIGMARRVTIAAGDTHTLKRLQAELRTPRHGNVQVLRVDPLRPLPLRSGALELIVARGAEAGRLLRSRTCMAELSRLLSPGGCVYLEIDRIVDNFWLRAHIDEAGTHDFQAPRVLLPVYWNEILRLAVPRDDHDVARYCFTHVVAGASRKGRTLQRVADVPVRMRLLPYLTPRRILLLERRGQPGESPPETGPTRLRERPLQAANASEAASRSALFARSGDDDNKVILLAFGRSKRPEMVLKIPRSTRYNRRLEHEHHCLTLLRERRAADAGTYPEALFLDYHAGLAIHGQTMLHGAAFRNVTTCRTDCPHAASAVEWITRLGEASAERVASDTDDLGGWLSHIFQRFLQVYSVSDTEADFLDLRIDELRRAAHTLPRVFQHGDAGTPNAVVDEEGRVGFFDWEDGDPRGLPLWDLFNFILCFGTWAGRVSGSRDDTLTYERSFIEPSTLARFQADAVARYCDRVGVDRHLVEPLYFAHMLARSLRSGIRVGGDLGNTPVFQPLRLAIQHRSGRGLACMFG